MNKMLGEYQKLERDKQEEVANLDAAKKGLLNDLKVIEGKFNALRAAKQKAPKSLIDQEAHIRQQITENDEDMGDAIAKHVGLMIDFLVESIQQLEVIDKEQGPVPEEDIRMHFDYMGQADMNVLGTALVLGETPDPNQQRAMADQYRSLLAGQKIVNLVTSDQLHGTKSSQPSADITVLPLNKSPNSPTTKPIITSTKSESGNTEPTSNSPN